MVFDTPRPHAFSRLCRLVLLGLILVSPAAAQVTGISYSAAPVGVRALTDGNTGLSNGYFYGGALGFGFGESLELSGEYLRGTDFKTEFDDFDVEQGIRDQLVTLGNDFDVDIERYGARLRLNVGRGKFLPFVSAGTGVLRMEPEAAASTESIYATLGAGITFTLQDRYTVTVEGGRFGYRYNPYAAFDLGTTAGLPATSVLNDVRTVFTNTITATARIQLGGRARGELTDVDLAMREQLRQPRFYAEPFYGQLQFSDDLDGFPEDQTLVGVQAGLDLGPLIGLRGFYGRATGEDEPFGGGLFETRDLTLYGGELNLRFDQDLGGGITPYAIVGGGYMDIGDYRPDPTVLATPESRYFAMGGVGVDAPLNRTFRLKAAIRALLMANEEADNVSDPSGVYASFLPTVGVEFSLGGGKNNATPTRFGDATTESGTDLRAREVATLRQRLAEVDQVLAMQTVPATAAQRAERQRLVAELGRLGETNLPLMPVAARADVVNNGVVPATTPAATAGQDTLPVQAAPVSNFSDRTMTVPIPESGEIYIRFGAPTDAPAAAPIVVTPDGAITTTTPNGTTATVPGAAQAGLTAEQVAAIVRQVLAEDTTRRAASEGGLTEAQAALLIQQALNDRLSSVENRLDNRADQTPVIVTTPGAASDNDDGASLSLTNLFGRRLSNGYPTFGIRSGQETTQFMIGARAEYRSPSGGPLLVPEVAVGLGDGFSMLIAANMLFESGNSTRGLFFHYGAGAGVLTRSGFKGAGLALNLLTGVTYPIGPGSALVEVSTLDLFQYTRVAVGYKLTL